MKNRISSDIRIVRFLFLILALGLLYLVYPSFLQSPIATEDIIVKATLILLCIIFYIFFNRAKTIEFDHEFLYISGKSGEEKLPLGNVFKIKLTMTQLNDRHVWKIWYYDVKGQANSVRFLPRLGEFHFDEFKNLVKSANKSVDIKSFSHSFDLDQ